MSSAAGAICAPISPQTGTNILTPRDLEKEVKDLEKEVKLGVNLPVIAHVSDEDDKRILSVSSLYRAHDSILCRIQKLVHVVQKQKITL